MSRSAVYRLLPLIALVALSLLFFRDLAFSERILARGDAYNYFYPYWDARNAAFRNGELPLWTDTLFMGAPLLANPQLGTFYPLNWITAPFRAPTAIKLSILLHSLIAGLGMAWLYRQAIGKGTLPALTAAIVYSFGGYLGAHVEQINQFQGLAWLPILFALLHRLMRSRSKSRDGLWLALALALQIFCGHTQTVFISGVGLGVYAIGLSLISGDSPRQIAKRLMLLLGCVGIALLLAMPQLLPSAELMGMSNRGGGFNAQEATAFSLPGSLLGRALLPGYDGQLFGEYVGAVGVIGLGLALWGALTGDSRAGDRRLWLLIALLGILLALGRHNPLYLPLAQLPGFNLFRVPARFLALSGLAFALLAGLGLSSLRRPQANQRPVIAIALVIGGLIFAARFVLQPDPGHFFGDSAISDVSLALWGLAWLLLLILLRFPHRWTPLAAIALVLGELLLAASNLPYNDLAPPQSYLGQRFSISQLLAYQQAELVPSRVLSISQRYFDPGDISAMRARYDKLGLGQRAQFHALDAAKKQLTLSPNLALTWGIPSIDGFGGGITPTIYYSQFTSLLLPDAAPRAVDGRLGERLALPECRGACLPELRFLKASDTRYLISDKVHDIWYEDIAYDLALADYWQGVERIEPPAGAYNQYHLLHSAPLPDRNDSRRLENDLLLTIVDAAEVNAVLAGKHSLLAVTAVNSRADAVFRAIQPPPFERALSSDIKLYRLPKSDRAYLASEVTILPDSWAGHEAALEALRQGAADVIHGDVAALPLSEAGQVDIAAYSATRVDLQVQSPAPAWLILRDAWYPGWRATVNGEPAPIYRANVMFRALQVPAGRSQIVFFFEPQMWRAALIGGVVLWCFALLSLAALTRRGRQT